MMSCIREKLVSGRWIFTIIGAIVFAVLSMTNKLPSDKVVEILMIIILSYFNKGDRNQNGGGAK
jgi:hypothetical protein